MLFMINYYFLHRHQFQCKWSKSSRIWVQLHFPTSALKDANRDIKGTYLVVQQSRRTHTTSVSDYQTMKCKLNNAVPKKQKNDVIDIGWFVMMRVVVGQGVVQELQNKIAHIQYVQWVFIIMAFLKLNLMKNIMGSCIPIWCGLNNEVMNS